MPYAMTRQDPRHLKDFDPKTFWPSVAVQSDSLSIYPNSSVSNVTPRRPSLPHSYESPFLSLRTSTRVLTGYAESLT